MRLHSVYCDSRPWDTSSNCNVPDPVMTFVDGGFDAGRTGAQFSEKQDILNQLAEIAAALQARQVGDAGINLRSGWVPNRKITALIKKLNRRLKQIEKLESRGLMGMGLAIDPLSNIVGGAASIFATLKQEDILKKQAKLEKARAEAEAKARASSQNFWMYLLIGAGAITVSAIALRSLKKQ